jgi:excisionase family DNA binding protein
MTRNANREAPRLECMKNELSNSESARQVEGLIDKTEVARRAHITTRTVDSWMQQGILPYYKLNRRVRFKWADVEAHISRNYRVVRINQRSKRRTA